MILASRTRLSCNPVPRVSLTIEQRAEDVLLEVPAIHGATYVVGDLPDLALQGGSLLGACHSLIPEFTSR